MHIKTLSISEVNGYIKKIFAGDIILNNLSIRGEISNFRLVAQSNTCYFSLKDENSSLHCIMFMDTVKDLSFIPADGMEITAHGRITLYEKSGGYSLNVDGMEPYGVGAYYMAFNNMKKKLEAEGLFESRHKRALPQYPKKIGVITSINGAAIHDILKVISGRYPFVDIDILPITVQGERSADDICGAFDVMNDTDGIDLIILARGGGSAEDIWHFNEESVARAIYDSKCPVISAVGHETDFTISDFVADARAATPTEAATMAVPDKRVLADDIEGLRDYLIKYMEDTLSKEGKRLDFIVKSSPLSRPDMFFEKYQSNLGRSRQMLEFSMSQYLNKKQMNMQALERQLKALDPLDILKRGYAIVYDAKNDLITDASSLKTDDDIEVRLHNALIECRVKEVSDIE